MGVTANAVAARAARRVACSTALVGIATLPPGFCAIVYADTLGGARHMAVAPNGNVFVVITNRQNLPGVLYVGAGRGSEPTIGDVP
jgi:hypothetical protein